MAEAPISEASEVAEALELVRTGLWYPLPEAFRIRAATSINSVLLETTKQDTVHDRSLLFLEPFHELVAWASSDLDGLLREIDRHLAAGFFVAGYLGYECGEHFVGLPPRPCDPPGAAEPIAWFGVFEAAIEFDHSSGTTKGNLPTSPATQTSSSGIEARVLLDGLQISRQDYRASLAHISEYLSSGDTYQVNFTDRVTGSTNDQPLAVYNTLLRQQPVPFAAFLNRAAGPLLSFSPELFFRTTAGRISVRPMKGTWMRGMDLAEDRKAAYALLHDEKNRSEHIMIVDLLRNDLGRICKFGSVQVDKLFEVETYNTLLQLTSTCSGLLQEGLSPSQVLVNLFPSGSITGAPKRRTMEIIRELEHKRRGTYTGSIGYFGPGGEACFNVAIRTVELQNGRVSMGVGGGITADSKPDEEFEECQLKASFLSRRVEPFALLETMRCQKGISLLPLHMQRISDSAQYFGIPYDEARLRSELTAAIRLCGDTESKVRVELGGNGAALITTEPLSPVAWGGRLLLADECTCSTNLFLRHKTTQREFYERQLAAARALGFDEVVFLNERSEVTEGAISNIFFLVDGRWLTPGLVSGVLPGVQRAHVLRSFKNTEETKISIDDLHLIKSICVTSALRGIRPIHSIERTNGKVLWKSSTRTSALPHLLFARASG